MATFNEVIRTALERGHGQFQPVNPNLMEVSRASKRRPAYLKVRVPEEIALNYLIYEKPPEVGFLILFDGDTLNSIAREIDERAVKNDLPPEEGQQKL